MRLQLNSYVIWTCNSTRYVPQNNYVHEKSRTNFVSFVMRRSYVLDDAELLNTPLQRNSHQRPDQPPLVQPIFDELSSQTVF